MISILAQAADYAVALGIGITGAGVLVGCAKLLPWPRRNGNGNGNGNGKPAVDELARSRLKHLERRDVEIREDKEKLWDAVEDIRKSSAATATSAAVIAERTKHLPCLTDGRGCPERNPQ